MNVAPRRPSSRAASLRCVRGRGLFAVAACVLALLVSGCDSEEERRTAEQPADPHQEAAIHPERGRTLLEQYNCGEIPRDELVRRIRDGLRFSWTVARDSEQVYHEKYQAYEPPELYVRCGISASSDPALVGLPLKIEVRILDLRLGDIRMHCADSDDASRLGCAIARTAMVWDDYEWPGANDVDITVFDGDDVAARASGDPRIPLPSAEIVMRQMRDAKGGTQKTLKVRFMTRVYHEEEKLAEGIDERDLQIEFFKFVPSAFWNEPGASDLLYPMSDKLQPPFLESFIEGEPSLELLEFKISGTPEAE